MLESLNTHYTILASGPPAATTDIDAFCVRYPHVPDEYLNLVRNVTELELQWRTGAYVRIWGPSGCVEMDDSYDISLRMPGAIPIGDDGGGRVILYFRGASGQGLYTSGFGDLSADNALYLSPALEVLLTDGLPESSSPAEVEESSGFKP